MPFLTLEDPNAKIKGSRDALGTTPIWSAFARHIISNLTTQTTSIRGFTILLLGRYFGNKLIESGRLDRENLLDVVLRMEQIGGHVRFAAHGSADDTRGIERIKSFQEEGRGKVTISTDQQGLILSDQKVTGLWGLYTVAAERSGLVPEDRRGVTEVASRFIEKQYLPKLETARVPLMKLLERGGSLDTRRKNPVLTAVASVLPDTFAPAEAEFYRHHLCFAVNDSGDGAARQRLLCRLLEDHTDLDEPLGREVALFLAERASADDEALARRLRRIVHLEALIAPAAALFDHVLTRNGQTPKYVGAGIRDHWGPGVPNLDADAFDDILPEIRDRFGTRISTAMRITHTALRAGEYEQAVRSLLDWNGFVMTARKAGPWAVLTPDGRIDVRYRGLEHLLPTREELDRLWYNSYFVDSLKRLLSQLEKVA